VEIVVQNTPFVQLNGVILTGGKSVRLVVFSLPAVRATSTFMCIKSVFSRFPATFLYTFLGFSSQTRRAVKNLGRCGLRFPSR
jgi:hypothetical protein